jgi:IS30 family transposase
MKNYNRLTEQERYVIENGIRKRMSIGAIACSIDRYKSTISREINKNGGIFKYYAAESEYRRVRSSRIKHSKIDSSLVLKQYVLSKLKLGWSPKVIAGRWNMKNNGIKISHETIYTWVYRQNDNLYLLLPRKKKKRGLKPQRNKSKIKDRISIHQRPSFVEDRSEIGHWEGDLAFQKGNRSQNITTLIERKTRLTIFIKNESKKSNVVIKNIKNVQNKLSKVMKTITFDNGSEFALHRHIGIDTYFCDPGSPWQKGAVENANGILRKLLDYRINASQITQDTLNLIAKKLNNIPREILGFLTPTEYFKKLYKGKLESVAF